MVNVLDLYKIIGQLNVEAGTVRYREGLDLVPDSVGNIQDYLFLLQNACFGQAANTGGTAVIGRVFDGIGNPLEGVRVQVGADGPNAESVCSSEFGIYIIPVDSNNFGEN